MSDRGISRRNFLYVLAGSSGALISGYFLASGEHSTQPVEPPVGIAETAPAPSDARVCPRLAGNLVRGHHEEMESFTHTGPDGEVVCAVNNYGALVLNQLDGSKTIEEVARELANSKGLPTTQTMVASVARFVADAGAAGLLQEPFHAMIVYQTTSEG